MNRVEQIDNEIESLKAQLKSVKGTETEIYARIVGYYRSVKNWNKGKKAEFNIRKEFSNDFNFPQINCCGFATKIEERQESTSEIKNGYLYFSRKSCPNCPPVKNFLTSQGENFTEINVDSDEGLELASQYEVRSTPTAIYFDAKGKELFRANSVADLKKALAVAC